MNNIPAQKRRRRLGVGRVTESKYKNPKPFAIFLCVLTIGLLSLSYSHDTRDSLMNPKSGVLLTQNVEVSPGFFAAESDYFRFFSQFYFYRTITGALVYASGLRLGLGRGMEEDFLAGRRFFAGGGTTVRGFGRYELGPVFPGTSLPAGGEGVVIINQTNLRSADIAADRLLPGVIAAIRFIRKMEIDNGGRETGIDRKQHGIGVVVSLGIAGDIANQRCPLRYGNLGIGDIK